ncbi:MAG TPA: S41 family peptidase [Candidatus Angelobacter sp.]
MARLLFALTYAALTLFCQAQTPTANPSVNQSGLAEALSFEAPLADGKPGGWNSVPPGTVFADDKVVHGGRWSARIERSADSPSTFSTITKSIPIDFAGKTFELRGFLRTEDVSGFAGLWMREDGDTSRGLAFDNMQRRQLAGTTAWTEYSIQLPVHPEAEQLFFGVLLAGTGKAWADDLQLLVDGKPVWTALRAERPKTALDLDHQFDGGSGVTIKDLTKVQIDNLVTLGRVWGFLKYHHPKVTSGQLHWDYELFRVLPAVLAAPDQPAARAVLLYWIEKQGPVVPCHRCAKLEESDLQLRSDLDWIANEALLGADLSQGLRSIHDNRSPEQQFYVSQVLGIGNPKFDHELSYSHIKLPDAGFQILGLYRFWNIIEYWSPYRDIVGEDWTGVLAEFIPRVALAPDAESYQRELMALIGQAHDGHANLWNSLDARPPLGKCQLPIRVRFVEGRPVITGLATNDASELKVGDAITELDGVRIEKLIERWAVYYAASNDPARMRDIARSMTRGDCVESSVGILREGHELKFKVKRVPPVAPNPGGNTHDLPGPTFRLLSKDVAYLKLSSVKADDAAHYVEGAAGTKGLIIDIRNYPSSFMVFALGSLLVSSETPFTRFTVGDLSNPGAFHWTKPLSLSPKAPHYSGKIVILADESSISQAEYTSMAFRAVPGAVVVGSTTAGADGNVSPFALPGGLSTMISGIGVFYPDKTPTQRIGIVPNIQVQPTLAGVREGRDEVLEEALRQILGSQTPLAEIEKMAKPQLVSGP